MMPTCRDYSLRRILIFGLLLGAGSVFVVHAQSPDMVFKIESGAVKEIELSETLEFTGSLEAWQDIEISSKIQAEITSLPLEEGQPVRKGELLFELDSRAEKIALERASGELEKAKSAFKKLSSGYLPDEIDTTRKALSAAEARLAAAEDEWERLSPLAEQSVIPASEATRAKAAYEIAKSEHSQAKSRLNLIEQGFRSEEVQVASFEVKVRQASVDDIKRRIQDHRITAPENGVVIAKKKEAGEWATVGEPVLTMVVLDTLRLRIEVPQAQVAQMTPGLASQMTVDGLPGELFPARVTNVIPQAKIGTRNFPVLLAVDNANRKLAAGMFARVKLKVGEPRKVLTIPREAVQYRGNKLVAYRVDGLAKDFVYQPPAPPPGKGAPKPGGPPPIVTMPDGSAREIEIIITDELETEVAIQPKVAGQLPAGSEIVVLGGSRLQEGSLVHRLSANFPGAG